MLAEARASDERRSGEIQRLQRKIRQLEERAGPHGTVAEALRERDLALTQAAFEKQVAEGAKSRLEEERATSERLRGRCAELERALSSVEKEASYLKSPAYEAVVLERGRPGIVQEFRHGVMGKTEVALACKAGSDFVMAQLPAGPVGQRGQLRYPPVIAGLIDVLADIEKAGGGYDVRTGAGGEDREEVSSRSTDSSAGEEAPDSDEGTGGDPAA